jgi:hypothetical protein
MHLRPSSIVRRRSSAIVCFVLCAVCSDPAAAQERLRIAGNVGQQTSTTTVSQEETFDRYFEQGSFTFERVVPKAIVYDFGAAVRLWRGLYAGGAVSIFNTTGPGTLTARVPHPLQFNKPRTTAGDVPDAERREIGQHIMFGWAIPAAGGLDFLAFAGPSIFTTEQLFASSVTLSLDKEVYPFDELAFPPVVTETMRDNVFGYNAGVDMTWRLNRNVGLGLLVRYSNGTTVFTPSSAQPVEVTVGGLHAGGGIRILFNSFGSTRKPPPPKQPLPKPPPPKQPPKK